MNIAIATSTRADWGLLSPLAHALQRHPGVKLSILATNMHLLQRFGHTVDEIIADGFADCIVPVPMPDTDDSDFSKASAMAAMMAAAADALDTLRPDIVVILGDRFEMLAIASASAVMRIPIAHLHGGETTEGAIDDNIRHAITQLSTLHFTAAEPYRTRVIAMGKNPAAVFNAGSLGVWNIANRPMMSLDELSQSLGFQLRNRRYLVVTFHPATLDTAASPADRVRALLEALDRFPDLKVIITYPNNDAGADQIIAEITAWAELPVNSDRVLLVRSLGMKRYLCAIAHAAAVVGNSSSGIIEVPSVGTPTVDIGIRQRGRLCADSVIHCGDSADDIAFAISKALSPQFTEIAATRENPYARPDTPDFIAKTILSWPL